MPWESHIVLVHIQSLIAYEDELSLQNVKQIREMKKMMENVRNSSLFVFVRFK